MSKQTGWIAQKNCGQLCPRCWHFMMYFQLPARSQRWAPYEWAWRCANCPEVIWLDGSINPKENTAEKIRQRLERKEMFTAIRSLCFSDGKSDSEIKKRPGRESWALPNDGNPAANCQRDESLTILADANIVSIGAIREIENGITEKEG